LNRNKITLITSIDTAEMITKNSCKFYKQKLEHGPRHSSINVDAFAISTACCDLDLRPPKCNQVISEGQWLSHVSFIKIARAVHEIIVVTVLSGRTNGQTTWTDSPIT